MSTLELGQALIDDADPKIRLQGVKILAEVEDLQADELLAATIADHSPEVWQAAVHVLRHRRPWLRLDPFKVRQPNQHALDTDEGRIWAAVKRGVERFTAAERPLGDEHFFRRWFQLRGALPDVHESLVARGEVELADQVVRTANLYGIGGGGRNQILLAPTYLCNIDCSYCYAKEWVAQASSHMSLEDLNTAFEWMSQEKIDYVILCGGEPTVYRHFDAMVEQARKRGIKIMLTSNGLMDERIRKLMSSGVIHEFIAHYDQDTLADNPTKKGLFVDNLIAVREAGVPTIMRYTLTETSTAEEWRPVLDIAQMVGVRDINYAFAFKNLESTNNSYGAFYSPDEQSCERLIRALMADCDSRGLRLHQSKPLPLCALSKDTLNEMLREDYLSSSCAAYLRGNTQNLTINPDLTTFPCNAVGILGPKITEFENMDAVSEHFSESVESLLHHPFQAACNGCIFFYRGLCQGVCLAEHHAMVEAETKAGTVTLPKPPGPPPAKPVVLRS